MIKNAKRLFGNTEMTWKKVIIFSVLTAIYTAAVLLIPALDGTSFRDIGVYPECWLLFAIFIVVNCKSPIDAALKCFVFFLISQPLIYLFQVPFYAGGFEIFSYYGRWFIITLLTFPGAMIAYRVSKNDLLSVLILSAATGLLAYQSAFYLKSVVFHFPQHLISFLFCIVTAVFLILVLIAEKKKRMLALGIFAVILIASIMILGIFKKSETKEIILDNEAEYYETTDDSVVEIIKKDEKTYVLTAKDQGSTDILFYRECGELLSEYGVTVSANEIILYKID